MLINNIVSAWRSFNKRRRRVYSIYSGIRAASAKGDVSAATRDGDYQIIVAASVVIDSGKWRNNRRKNKARSMAKS